MCCAIGGDFNKWEKTVFSGTVKETVKNSTYSKFKDAYLWYAKDG